MEMYVLKSTACLLIFFLSYKLFLERSPFHAFKRIFLLVSLLLALSIPLITFSSVELIDQSHQNSVLSTDAGLAEQTIEGAAYNVSAIIWTVYILGGSVFGFLFFRNLSRLILNIRNNTRIKTARSVRVLLGIPTDPHTFLKYIFLNETAYSKNSVPPEVIEHEEVHARQWHSLDSLLIETLLVLFWFNPVLWLYRKAIKLNHEFLADQAVLQSGTPVSHYQRILLAYSTKENQPALVNAINYSSIKKRMLIMKTPVRKKRLRLLQLGILPLIALLIWGFSSREVIYKPLIPEEPINSLENPTSESSLFVIEVLEDNTLRLDSRAIEMAYLNHNLSKQIAASGRPADAFEVKIQVEKQIELPFLNRLSKEIQKAGIYSITVDTPLIKMEEAAFKGNVEISESTVRLQADKITLQPKQEGATIAEMKAFEALAKKYNRLPKSERKIPLDELRNLERLYQKMTLKQRKSTEPFPECEPVEITVSTQDGATRQQMKEYETLAKKYNAMDRDNMVIKIKEVEKLKYIYGLMNEKQRKSAEPFPYFPEPPQPPPPPKVKTSGQVSGSRLTIASPGQSGQSSVRIKGSAISTATPPPPPPPPTTTGVGTTVKTNVPPPPPPPDPEDPLTHFKKMAAQGASFYLNGKKISSEEALKIAQAGGEMTINSSTKNKGKPVVRISN